MKIILFIISLCFLQNSIKAQCYNCQFLNLIVEGVKKHNEGYKAYSDAYRKKMDSYPIGSKNRDNISVSDYIIDSLDKCCNFGSFFDDSLFHIKDSIILIDTFHFFSIKCMKNNWLKVNIFNSLMHLPDVSKLPPFGVGWQSSLA